MQVSFQYARKAQRNQSVASSRNLAAIRPAGFQARFGRHVVAPNQPSFERSRFAAEAAL